MKTNIPLLLGIAMASLGNDHVPNLSPDGRDLTRHEAIVKRKNKKLNKTQRKSRKINRKRT